MLGTKLRFFHGHFMRVGCCSSQLDSHTDITQPQQIQGHKMKIDHFCAPVESQPQRYKIQNYYKQWIYALTCTSVIAQLFSNLHLSI